MANYHCSVYKEGNRWIAQVLEMPEEKVLRYRKFTTKLEADLALAEWKRIIGIK